MLNEEKASILVRTVYLIFFIASVVTNKFKRFSRLNSALVDQSERSNQDLISNIDVEKSEIEKSRKSGVSKVRRQSTFNNGHIKSNSLLKPSDWLGRNSNKLNPSFNAGNIPMKKRVSTIALKDQVDKNMSRMQWIIM